MSALARRRVAGELPDWTSEVVIAMQRGQHVLLSGNVADQYPVVDGYLDLRSVLVTILKATGHDAIGVYDVADGFCFADAGSEQHFTTICRAISGDGAHQGSAETLDEVLDALALARAVLRRSSSAAIVFDRADLLLPLGNDADTQRASMLLHRALRDAALTEPGLLAARNALVLVTPTMTRSLSALAAAEPLLVVIDVPLPSLDERRAFLRAAALAFSGAPGDGVRLERHVDSLARQTSGFTLWDMEALRRTSHLSGIGINEPHQLMLAHLRTRRESPWAQTDGQLLRNAAVTLGKDIIGQDHVLTSVAEQLVLARFGVGVDRDTVTREQRPRLVLFFVGPTGVGKTELCKRIARLIFGDAAALVRFDMGEFRDQTSARRLIGSDPGYVGFEQGGQLVNAVIRQPHCVLLFDEIEKADPAVLDTFLAILDEGRLTDGHGRTADFRDTIVVFTSNVGAATIAEAQRGGRTPTTEVIVQHFQNAVRDHLSLPLAQGGLNRPELYGRLEGAIHAFDVLRPNVIQQIAKKVVRQWRENVARVHGATIEFDEAEAVRAVIRHIGPDALTSGARPIERAVREILDTPVALWIADHPTPASEGFELHFDCCGRALVHE